MIRTFYIVGIIFFFVFQLTAKEAASYLSESDTVWVKINPSQQKYFEHVVKPKQTLYSLSKFYGIDMLSIYDQNPYLKNDVLDVHDTVKVTLQNTLIQTISPDNESDYAPVYYRVQKKDNLFRIARRYFDLPVKELMSHNQLNDYNLDINQALLIGWIHLDGARHGQSENSEESIEHKIISPYEIKYKVDNILSSKPEDNPSSNEPSGMTITSSSEADSPSEAPTPIKSEIKELKTSFEAEKIKYMYQVERGVAHWSKGIKHKTDLYVLHKTAPVGSTVEVTNPLINKSIYAKVIAPLPNGMYADKVKVIVSPAVANLLGAIDSQFFVKVKYLAPEN